MIAQRQHRAILDAVAAGAGARAEKLAREHSNLAKRSLHAAAKRDAPQRKAAAGNFVRLQLAAV
jgi:GntR family transcriptional regulator of vanillate catabolism